MPEALLESMFIAEPPDITYVITEDETPVDNIFSAKQQRLLVESLYSSWKTDAPFLAEANVGIFSAIHQPPIVPDLLLSIDVQPPDDLWPKENRSYFLWKYGKPPEVVMKIVSNAQGGEGDKKLHRYARIGVWYYVVFDPMRIIQQDALRIYELSIGRYILKQDRQLTQIGLGLTLWNGVFEGQRAEWLRWRDSEGRLLLTGAERAERLAAKLRELGVEDA